MKKIALSLLSVLPLFFFAVCTAAAHLRYAITQNPIVGRASGRVGNSLFYTILGKNVWKSKPITEEIERNDSVPRLTQRMKFDEAFNAAKILKSVVQSSFKTVAVGMSSFNKFMSGVLRTTYNGTYPNLTVDLSAIRISNGAIVGLNTPAAAAAAGKVVNFTWIDDSLGDETLATDEVCVVLLNTTAGPNVPTHKIVKQAATRDTAAYVCSVPTGWVGDTIAVWVYVQSYVLPAEEVLIDNSPSQYLGTVVILT